MSAPLSHYDRVGKAIEIYENAVQNALTKLRKRFYIDISNISMILALVIVSAFFSNIAGLLTSLGLGTTNVATQGSSWTKTIRAYLNDSGTLLGTVSKLKGEHVLCKQTDVQCLRNVEGMIRENYKALASAAK